MSNHAKHIAFALAGLFAAAAPLAVHAGEKDKKETAEKKVHCEGINKCAGHGACKSADNACAGKNGCAGKGWVESTEKECKDKGGKIVAQK